MTKPLKSPELNHLNNTLTASLAVFNDVAKTEKVTGYVLIALSDNHDDKGFYYTFNSDHMFDLIGIVDTIKAAMIQHASVMLSDDPVISSNTQDSENSDTNQQDTNQDVLNTLNMLVNKARNNKLN